MNRLLNIGSKNNENITNMENCLTCNKELESLNKEFCGTECAIKFLNFKTKQL